MTPELIDAPSSLSTDTDSDAAALLIGAANAIREWQNSRPSRLVDEALVRRFPALGSTKTYKRLLSGDTAELRCEAWLTKYRGVLAQIDAEEAAVSGHGEIYDDLSPTTAVRAAMQSLIRSRGLERLVIIEGGTGSGKTSALRCVEEAHKGACVRCEAHEGWRSFTAAMGDLALAVGVAGDLDKLPVSGAARLARVIAAQETIWRKLQACSWQEAKQLIYNRMRERVKLTTPSAEDVGVYLQRRAGVVLSEAVCRRIGSEAGKLGDFAALRRLAERLLELPTDDRGDQSALESLNAIKQQLA